MNEKHIEPVVIDGEPLHCIGCGAVVQTTDKTAPGYTPQSALDKGIEKEEVYCQRCFRLRHYNEIVPVGLTDDDFLRLLTQIQDANALIVYVVDIFDFNGSVIPGLHRFVGDNPVLLVGNKEDLLPRSLKRSKLRDWLRQRANEEGLRPIDVTLLSAKTNQSVDGLLQLIDKYRGDRDVYVVGVTNVGKSTLINQVIRQNTGVQDLITTSRFPGTTLDKIELPLDDDHVLVDTPGIIQNQQMAHYLDGKDLKIVTPQKPIKPKNYQLNDQQTLFLGGIARFDYTKGPKNGFTAYFENNLYIHRTKLENADDFYARQLGQLLTPPHADTKDDFPPLVAHEFKTTVKSDLVFEGLGWITVPAGVNVTGWAPAGVGVLIRRAMI
ncbi:MAG: ribosome biogenesis GTPase YqeH [Levilactobacillus sp.]|jgi:ribosome biogenesis GTPase YqeH|uniref:Ribosome biogenesis GTPase YqeH n=1 Tax=Levilactobacillus suantsaiihabitans TaxID=2487722 RepID=A0A4Z0JAP2_9LACO|nr:MULTISPECIES: ribosome biogenesis GTPase YqeH [Levilactobacillus]MCH4123513.1 ribosome biogenesis GTPase YqeH [Levilactobacillus sp.]MCI1552349.1 ribosome biogenesis GTPase YqeH [Levilactobacillus sp.]MCI1598691.1 ribosome biogenesis GTPase YqeH [Levilactobacillus sp.]MCI1606029.1 ribosome biogenesis GTPase YqeH [Levilactobacillus sp.]TGD18847.1 ribosome biogenesis GTPase YqeH [Levilactobacillus suantsaiihabitans]